MLINDVQLRLLIVALMMSEEQKSRRAEWRYFISVSISCLKSTKHGLGVCVYITCMIFDINDVNEMR